MGFANLHNRFNSLFFGHDEVGYHESYPLVFIEHPDSCDSVAGLNDLVPFPFQCRADEFSDGGIIINDKNVHAAVGLCGEMTSLIVVASSERLTGFFRKRLMP